MKQRKTCGEGAEVRPPQRRHGGLEHVAVVTELCFIIHSALSSINTWNYSFQTKQQKCMNRWDGVGSLSVLLKETVLL